MATGPDAADRHSGRLSALTSRLDRWRGRLAAPHAALAGLVLLACVLVALYVHAYSQISPADESQHIDYLLKASHGHLVARGDFLGQETLREETCRRLDAAFSAKVPRCTQRHLDARVFQEGGYNTAYIHPPTYYAIDGVLARGLHAATPGHHDIVTFARLVGMLWLSAAVVLIWLVLGEFETPTPARVVLIVLLLTAPTVLHFSSIVNPDGAALATGAAILLATLRYERRNGSWIVPAVLSAFAIATKSTNAFGVGVCLIYIAVRSLQKRYVSVVAGGSEVSDPAEGPSSTRRYLVLASAMVGGLAIVGILWSVVSAAIAHVPSDQIPMIHRFLTKSYPSDALKIEWRAAISPLRAAYIPHFLASARIVRIASIVNACLIAGTVLGIAYSERGSRMRALAISALVVMVLVGPIVLSFNYIAEGIWYKHGTVPRYGLSILPAAITAASVPLRRRGLLLGASALAALIAVSTIVQMARH